MKAVSRLDHNFTYRGPTEEIGDLSCRVEEGQTFSHWRPSSEELEVLNDGGLVELTIIGHPIPPVAINVEPADQPEVVPPFKRPQEG